MNAEHKFETMDAGEDGWTDFVHPLPGYLMKCCDCGCVHEMDARVVQIIQRDGGNFEWDDVTKVPADLVVVMRMRRPS
jgi:hypothetical protein